MFGTIVVVKPVNCRLKSTRSKCQFLSKLSGFQCKWKYNVCKNKRSGWKIKQRPTAPAAPSQTASVSSEPENFDLQPVKQDKALKNPV
jgi:hypothetical protein